MKILVLAWEFPPRIVGGISRHVADLYPELVKLGHTVHLITIEVSKAPNYEVKNGISVHRVPVASNQDFSQWVVNMNASMEEYSIKLIDEILSDRFGQNFDLIHAHDWLVVDAAIAISEKFHIPITATIHATEYGRFNGIHNDTQNYVHQKEILLSQKAQRVIVCTNYMSQEVERALGCPPAKVDVVYNGLSAKRIRQFQQLTFNRAEMRSKYAEPDEAIIYYVGRLTHEKGIFLLLNAAPKVIAAQADKVKFVIIGSGDAHSILLQRQAWDLGIYHKVVFTGFMSDEDLCKLQTIADCAVFPSLYEPFGIVALEGFAAGVPVVVSNTGGMPEVVQNDVTGVVTAVNNSDSIAEGIIKILQNPDFSQKLVTNAQQDLQTRFTWPKLAKQTEAVYQKTVSEFKQ